MGNKRIEFEKRTLKLLLFIAIFFVGTFGLMSISYADGIEIEVGFEGGPYIRKNNFDDAHIKNASDGNYHWYSYVDTNNNLKYDYGKGVSLQYLIEEMSRIDIGSVKRYIINTEDEYIKNNKSITSEFLFGKTRSYYPNLYKFWPQRTDSRMYAGVTTVEPMLAYETLPAMLSFTPGQMSREDFTKK